MRPGGSLLDRAAGACQPHSPPGIADDQMAVAHQGRVEHHDAPRSRQRQTFEREYRVVAGAEPGQFDLLDGKRRPGKNLPGHCNTGGGDANRGIGGSQFLEAPRQIPLPAPTLRRGNCLTSCSSAGDRGSRTLPSIRTRIAVPWPSTNLVVLDNRISSARRAARRCRGRSSSARCRRSWRGSGSRSRASSARCNRGADSRRPR